MKQLTIYSIESCPKCEQAAKLLASKGVKFEVIKADEDPYAYNFITDEGHRSFPQIYDGKRLFVVGGFAGLQKLGPEAFREFY
jgi:glutaredoxin